MLYIHAVIPRLGLGNCLLPWARAEVCSQQFGWPMLSPAWFKPKIGPFLRRETDKRLYWRLFQPDGYVRGAERLAALWLGPRIAEPAGWYEGAGIALPKEGVVLIRGLKPPDTDCDYFRPLWGHRNLLQRRLRQICRAEILNALPDQMEPFIGVHVRRGDLAESLSDPRNPIHVAPHWFDESVRSLLRLPEFKGTAIKVMTDGDERDREQFRDIPRVEFVDLGNAVSNMAFMARSLVFLGTGYSTFSRWISFLGGMPTLYYPGYVPPVFGGADSAFSGAFAHQEPVPEVIRQQCAERRNLLGRLPVAIQEGFARIG